MEAVKKAGKEAVKGCSAVLSILGAGRLQCQNGLNCSQSMPSLAAWSL
jgi:hypothetical protein